MEILDAHQHLGIIEDFTHAKAKKTSEDPDVVELRMRLASMDASGIHRAILGPSYQYLMPNGIADTRRYNDRIAAFRRRAPQRFPFAIGAIEPRQGPAAVEEVRRIKEELGMVGFMSHARLQGCYVDSPWMRKCVREAADLGMAPFVHSHHGSLLESPWRVERLAQEFPETTFVVLDGLAGYEEPELFFDICKRRDNLLFDTGMWSNATGKLMSAAKVLGARRLVFGSGLYSYPMGFRRTEIVQVIRESSLSDVDKAGVLAGNLYRVLGRKPLGMLKAKGR